MSHLKSHLDLMPSSLHHRFVLRRCLRVWTIIWLVAVVLLGAYFSSVVNRSHSANLAWSGTQRDANKVQKQQEEIARLRRQVEQFRNRDTLELVDRRPFLTLLRVISVSTERCGGQLCLTSMTATRNAANTSEESEQVGGLSLNGLANSNLAVAQFVTQLRDSGIFSMVELKSSESVLRQTASVQSYTVECSF